MSKLLEIDQDEIYRLSDVQLHQLLNKLLYLESEKNGISEKTIHVSLTPRQKDGGEDGRIVWDHPSKEKTDYFPTKDVFFQCKQRKNPNDFSATHCEKELVYKEKETKKIRVKERIHDLFLKSGTYVLFCNFSCDADMMTSRINGFRKGLQAAGVDYAKKCDIQIYDGQKIAEWTNKFSSAVVFVCNCNGRKIPLGAKIWSDWVKYPKNSNKYFSDQTLADKIVAIRSHFTDKQKVARIIGHSGLGKTRLALEAFRPPNEPNLDINQYRLSEKIIYIDARDELDIVPIVKHWRENGLSGILIIDECDCKTHDRLIEEIKHPDSEFSLLSIDYSDDCGIKEDPIIKLDPVNDVIIEQIISAKFPKLPEPDIKRIVQIAQGYPQMAVLIAEDRSFGAATVGTITKREIVDRLIGGRTTPTETEKKVITACSLFTSFRVKGEAPTHVEFIAKKICNIDPAEFSRTVNEIKSQRGIIEERGRFFRVIPKPLAITLATEWWKYCSQEQAEELLLGKTIPEELVNPLCNQFRYLNLEPEIQELSKELCKERRPFGQAEILNSERGSRIFRSIAEVNPSAAVDALYRCFGESDKEGIRQIKTARRNLVWALENLVFWNETFPKAARLLLKLAVCETEPGIGNNATGQFHQLFHYRLSGTQASPDMRLAIIDEGLSTNDPEFQKICLTALGHALQTHFFSRNGGVETQGSRYSHKDWEPKTWREVFDYWDASLIRLKKYALIKDSIGTLACSQIENSIDGMLWYGRLDILEDVIFSICEVRGFFWPRVLFSLKRFVNLHSKDIPQEGKVRIDGWIQRLGPQSISDLTYVTIIHPDHFATFEGEDFIKTLNEQVEKFTKDLVTRPEDLVIVLQLLSKNPSTHGHLFGYTLCNCVDDKKSVINTIFDSLKTAPVEKMDGSVLGGFLFALRSKNSNLVSEYLERISKDPQLFQLLSLLTAHSLPEKIDLDRLIAQLKEGKIDIESFSVFQYGSVLRHLKPNVVTVFFDDLLANSKEGCSVVFELAYMYTFNDELKRQECLPFFKKMIIERDCLLKNVKNSNFNGYLLHEVNEISTYLLRQENPDFDIAIKISNDIIALCSNTPSTFGISTELNELFSLLLAPPYVEKTWPIFGNAIISGDYDVIYHLKVILGSQVEFGKWNHSFLDKISLSILSQWCEENPDKAPVFISEAILPLIEVNKQIIWSPLAIFLINKYGNDSNVLSGLTEKMWNFSWVDSQTPFYETWLNGFTALLSNENPNVKIWAEKNIDYLKSVIQKTQTDDDEREIYCR